jgi:hypothetical protein
MEFMQVGGDWFLNGKRIYFVEPGAGFLPHFAPFQTQFAQPIRVPGMNGTVHAAFLTHGLWAKVKQTKNE